MLCYITYIELRVECSCYDHWSFFFTISLYLHFW